MGHGDEEQAEEIFTSEVVSDSRVTSGDWLGLSLFLRLKQLPFALAQGPVWNTNKLVCSILFLLTSRS